MLFCLNPFRYDSEKQALAGKNHKIYSLPILSLTVPLYFFSRPVSSERFFTQTTRSFTNRSYFSIYNLSISRFLKTRNAFILSRVFSKRVDFFHHSTIPPSQRERRERRERERDERVDRRQDGKYTTRYFYNKMFRRRVAFNLRATHMGRYLSFSILRSSYIIYKAKCQRRRCSDCLQRDLEIDNRAVVCYMTKNVCEEIFQNVMSTQHQNNRSKISSFIVYLKIYKKITSIGFPKVAFKIRFDLFPCCCLIFFPDIPRVAWVFFNFSDPVFLHAPRHTKKKRCVYEDDEDIDFCWRDRFSYPLCWKHGTVKSL